MVLARNLFIYAFHIRKPHYIGQKLSTIDDPMAEVSLYLCLFDVRFFTYECKIFLLRFLTFFSLKKDKGIFCFRFWQSINVITK